MAFELITELAGRITNRGTRRPDVYIPLEVTPYRPPTLEPFDSAVALLPNRNIKRMFLAQAGEVREEGYDARVLPDWLEYEAYRALVMKHTGGNPEGLGKWAIGLQTGDTERLLDFGSDLLSISGRIIPRQDPDRSLGTPEYLLKGIRIVRNTESGFVHFAFELDVEVK